MGQDLDASVLRFVLDGQNYLALLGEDPLPADAGERLNHVIETGSEATELPAEAANYLRSRRRQFKGTGLNYLERRTQMGPGGTP